MKLTLKQLEAAKIILAKENGKKGGRSWWDNLTEEDRNTRISKMVEIRKNNKLNREKAKETPENLTEQLN